jgi:hypothetical protein
MFQVTADGRRPIKEFETVAQGARFPGAGFFVAGGAVGGSAVPPSDQLKKYPTVACSLKS